MRRHLIIAFAFSSLLGCSDSKDLTRRKAVDLVKSQVAEGVPLSYSVTCRVDFNSKDPWARDSIATHEAGLWVNTTPQRINDLRLTEKGAKYFTATLANAFVGNYTLTSRFRLVPDVSITGIKDEGLPSHKVVEYVLTYHNECPEEIHPLCTNLEGGQKAGSIRAELYDDGWRIKR